MIDINTIPHMTLEEVTRLKKVISLSNADRDIKTQLYEACEKREADLDIGNAMVIRSETDD